MKKILLLILSLLTLTVSAQENTQSIQSEAQNDKYTVKGSIVHEDDNTPAEYIVLSVLERDSTETIALNTTTAENGLFEFVLNKGGEYSLVLSSLTIDTKKIKLNLTEPVTDLGTLHVKMSNELIEESVLIAQRQIISNEIDKLIYSVEDDPEAKTENALEILRKVPRVTVDGNDNILVNGKSNFAIYVNGRPSSLFAREPGKILKNLPASSIKKMEIISEPGAKYDAEGVGGILNIVMNSGGIDGYNLSLSAYGGTSHLGGGAYAIVKAGKLSVSANYSPGYYSNPGFIHDKNSSTNISSNENLLSDELRLHSFEGTSQSRGMYNMGNIEASYEIDSLNLISLSGRLSSFGNTSVSNMSSLMQNSLGNDVYSYNQASDSKNGSGGGSFNLDYQRISKKNPNEVFTVSYRFDYDPSSSYSTNSTYDLIDPNNHLNILHDSLRYENNNAFREHTFQADYSTKFKDIHLVETGIKYIHRGNLSNGEYFSVDNGVWNPITNDPTRKASDYNNYMNIAAVYASYGFKYKEFGAKIGLRNEFSMQNVEDKFSPERNFNVNYNDLVPNVMLSWQPSMTQNLNLSYNMRISRPSIHYLDPFVQEHTPSILSMGNPDLVSERNHSIYLSYGRYGQKFNINAGLSYSFSNNGIENYSYYQGDKLISTYDNIGISQNLGGSLYLNYNPTVSTRIYVNASAYYSILSGKEGNEYLGQLSNSGLQSNVFAGFQQSFNKGFRIGANGGYYGGGVSLQGESSGGYYYGINVSKSFLNDKLTIGASVQNFAEDRHYYTSSSETDYLISKNEYSYIPFSANIYVSFTFGNLKNAWVKKANKSISNDDLKAGGESSSGGQGGASGGAGGGN